MRNQGSPRSTASGPAEHCPVGPAGAPTSESVAGAAVFLVSDVTTYVTGVTLPVDGGWTLTDTTRGDTPEQSPGHRRNRVGGCCPHPLVEPSTETLGVL